MDKLTEKPQLAIHSGNDGVWLHFTLKNGNTVGINLQNTFTGNSFKDRTITSWAEEYANGHKPE